MTIPPVLRALLTAHGPSGYETAPAAVFRDAASAFADVSTDVMGSVWARVPGTAGGPTLAIVGHIDEIGLIVSHIDDDGFLRFHGVGGWDPQILVGQRVLLGTRDGTVPGVVGKKPIHLLKEEERKQVARLEEMHIDIGAASGEEARSLVRVGDVAVIEGEPIELPNGRAVSRSMDNRLGAYVAYEAARLVHEAGGAPGDTVAVAAVQEETTFGGATTTAYALRPDVAIVVDVTHATDAPGVEVNELGAHPFGSGPVIERGSNLNPRVVEIMYETAESESIPYTLQASARSTGTDLDAMHLSRGGIPAGGVGLPLRYMHSPVEMVQLDDIDKAARLVAAVAQRLTAETSFAR
ncbi:MAG TPA: M42 family metallopeptidase [Solirubrobacteraceae bacterium]